MSKHFHQMPLITYVCFPVGGEAYIRILHKHQVFLVCAMLITDLWPVYILLNACLQRSMWYHKCALFLTKKNGLDESFTVLH